MTGYADRLLAPTAEEQKPSSGGYAARLLGGGSNKNGLPLEVDTNGAASIGQVAAASLFSDPEKMVGFYSSRLGIPRDKFQFVDKGEYKGALGYQTDKGTLQLVAPGFARELAAQTGPSIPAIGGALGAVAGLPAGGPVGAAGGGMLGAMGGQSLREGFANQLGGQDVSYSRIATEGTVDLASTLGGVLLGKGLARPVVQNAVSSFRAALQELGGDASIALQMTLDKVNKEYGTNIRLTPAELTGNADLRGQQIAVEGRPKGAPIIQDYQAERAGEMDTAMRGFLDTVSPDIGKDAAGEGLVKTAGSALDRLNINRNVKGSPAYKQAFDAQTDMLDFSPAFEALESASAKFPRAKGRFKRARDLLETSGGNLENFQNNAKEELDRLIKIEERAGRPKIANALRDVKNTALAVADDSVPEYAAARKLWGDISDPITAAEGGVLPKLAGYTQKDFENVGRTFFGSASYGEIKRARAAILAEEGGQEAYNAALRGFLGDAWERAGREYVSNMSQPNRAMAAQGARFWADMYGNKDQQNRLKAAMSPKQWRAFRNLLDVFEATGRATNFNSTTASQGEYNKLIDQGPGVVGFLRFVASPLGTTTRKIDAGVSDRNAKAIAELITREDAVQELLKIEKGKGVVRNALIASKALNIAGQGAYGE